ncbi:IS21-like element helper ATPase IstB [Prosthecochloris sp. HL-130-GSB]|uniref:IS21-like element helper ATPase IstB n=1 Tax=Prosthecochloris sp. HL-130-GSB TaxID=1974213 RepID=UPI0012F4FD63|nr:IS21-like element helper ATPase IstB [Prosthecochloris sp. HL-130-GSB]
MMTTVQHITEQARELRLSSLVTDLPALLEQARREEPSYTEFAALLLDTELAYRQKNNLERRLKTAQLPLVHDLDQYDHKTVNGISKTQLQELRQLVWLDQTYNMLLVGPSGTGKTFLAGGLCYEAIKQGYTGLFRRMDDLIQTIKLKDITTSAAREYKRLQKAQLLVIDDIMMFPLKKDVSVGLFQLIDQLHEQTSFIITTNKNPKEWAEMLGDEVLATALLDRLLYRSEVIQLSGNSYRMEHRKTIFSNNHTAAGGADSQ